MSNTLIAKNIVSCAFAKGMRPDPKYSVSEWVSENIVLGQSHASEPGLMNIKRTPYLREILDNLGNDTDVDTVTVLKGAQLGFTTAGLAWLGYVTAYSPGPFLMVLPTLNSAKRQSTQRIEPIFRDSPVLKGVIEESKSGKKGNSVMLKTFPGGVLLLAGSNSASGLRSLPIRFLMLDELSAYDTDIQGEGSPVMLAKARTSTFKRNRKIFQISTPVTKGTDITEQEFEKSDKRYYNIVCPHCEALQPIRWSHIKWDKNDNGDHLPDTAYLECFACEKRIEEHMKTWMMDEDNGAQWIATTDGELKHCGYHLSSLYSPLGWYSWADAVKQFLTAKERSAKGDVSLLKTFTNTVLGETWAEEGQEVPAEYLYVRRQHYNAEVPQDAVFLTAGVDVQKDRVEISVYGFARDEEIYAITHNVIWGDTSNISNDVYTRLEEFIRHRKFKHESGAELPIMVTGIDAGYQTNIIYDFAKRNKMNNVYALMGDQSKPGKPIVKKSHVKSTGRDKRKIPLFNIGVWEAKRLIYSRLLLKGTGGGRIHFPIKDEFSEDFFDQITAERLVKKYVKGFTKYVWEKVKTRNEALDCIVYAYAMFSMYRPNIDRLREQFAMPMVQSDDSPPTEIEAQQQEPTQKLPKKRKRTGRNGKSWLNDY